MKKNIVIGLIAFAVIAVGTIFVIGQFTGGDSTRTFGRGGMHRGGGERIIRGLDLTDEQKSKVKELRDAHQQAVAPLHEAMKANREKLSAATANGAFDEAAVTAIANEHGSIAAQMMVAREKMKSQVYALLTDEQKAKFAEMEKNHPDGFGGMKGHRGGKHRGPRGPEGPGSGPAPEQPVN